MDSNLLTTAEDRVTFTTPSSLPVPPNTKGCQDEARVAAGRGERLNRFVNTEGCVLGYTQAAFPN